MTFSEKSEEEKIKNILSMQKNVLEDSNNLSKRLMQNVPLGMTQIERDKIFLKPGDYIEESQIDPFIFSTSCVASLLTLTLKDLYRKNKIRFDDKNLLSDDKLTDILPSPSILSFYGLGAQADFEDLCFAIPIEILKGIETQLYPVLSFDTRKSNPFLEKELKKNLIAIGNFAKLGIKSSELLKGCNFIKDYGAVRAVMESIKNPKELSDLLRIDKISGVHDRILGLHSQLRFLPYFGDCYSFSNSRGHEVDTIMHVTHKIASAYSYYSDISLSNLERIVVPVGKYRTFIDKGGGLRKDLNENWSDTIIVNLMADDDLLKKLSLMKYPFTNMTEQLTTLGIPSNFARKFTDTLSFNLVGREFSDGKTKGKLNFNKKGAFEIQGEQFPEELSRHLRNTTGKKLIPFNYKFLDSKTNRDSAKYIRAIGYVAKVKNKKIESILEKDFMFTPSFTTQMLSNRYPKDDIYVAENYGVCFLLDPLPLSDIATPKVTTVESRDLFDGQISEKSLKYKLRNLQVGFHEATHVAQIDSPLVRREIIMCVDNNLCDLAVKLIKNQLLDTYPPQQSLYRLWDIDSRRKLQTWRNFILDFHYTLLHQILGKGKIAEDVRKYGVANGLAKNNLGLFEGGEINVNAFRRIVPLEKSRARDIAREFEKAMTNGNLKEILAVEKITKNYEIECGGIIETQAQAFSVEALKTFISKTNGLRDSELAQKIYEFEFARGNFAQIYLDIVNNTQSIPERDSSLMQQGIKYQRIIEKGRDIEGIELKLVKLGIDEQNPFSIYDDMNQLRKIADNKNIPIKDLLFPMNSAYAMIGLRYDTNLPLFNDYINKVGSKKAFKDIINAESFDEIKSKL